jgi:hypothetical protein
LTQEVPLLPTGETAGVEAAFAAARDIKLLLLD